MSHKVNTVSFLNEVKNKMSRSPSAAVMATIDESGQIEILFDGNSHILLSISTILQSSMLQNAKGVLHSTPIQSVPKRST